MYAYICPDCGAHLDPGEQCDCIAEKAAKERQQLEQEKELRRRLIVERDGQLRFVA